MTSNRQHADSRAKQLQLAIFRIERGRAKTGEQKLSISAVAREAGVSAALIHNHYPEIAETIRIKLGASSRAQRDVKHQELKAAQERNRALMNELNDLRHRMAKLTSINETLLLENQALRAIADDTKVSGFQKKHS